MEGIFVVETIITHGRKKRNKIKILLRSAKRVRRRIRKLAKQEKRMMKRAARRQRDDAAIKRLRDPGVYDVKKELIRRA